MVDHISGVLLSNGQAFLLTQQNNLEKYIRLPHSGIKLQNLCSDQKTDNTIEFAASNYLKMIVSRPQYESGTPRPKINFVSVFVIYNLQLIPKTIPRKLCPVVPLRASPCTGGFQILNNNHGWYKKYIHLAQQQQSYS